MLWPSIPPHMPSSAPHLWLALAAVVATCAQDSFLSISPPSSSSSSSSSPSSSSCPSCVLAKRQLDQLRIETIKQQLLSKLGLRSKPNVTLSVPREVLLQTLYRSEEARPLLQGTEQSPSLQSLFEEEDNYYAKTSEIISFAEPGPQLNNHTLLEFSQSSVDVSSLRVKEASLWVFIRRLPGTPRTFSKHRPQTKLWVFILPSDPSFQENPSGRLVSSLNISVNDIGWQRLDVTEAIQWWFMKRGEQLRFLVDCSSCNGQLKAELFTTKKHKGAYKPGSRRLESSHRPFLVIRTNPSPSRRLARRALQCDKDTKMCCKQNLFVSFKDLDWDDWIIAPSGYQANYCKGSCASIYRTPDSFTSYYSRMAEELRRKALMDTITQCCAPKRLSSMTIIYSDMANNIIMRTLPGMVVEECGCP